MSATTEPTLNTFIEKVVHLPYWAGVISGLISYVVLHHFADLTVLQSSHYGHDEVSALKKSMGIPAYFGQFFIPFICFLGAYISARRVIRQGRFFSADLEHKTDSIRQIHWKEFKQLLTAYFTPKGFILVEAPGGAGADEDIHLKKRGDYYIVYFQSWKNDRITASIIRKQYYKLQNYDADYLVIVSSGIFSREAVEFAQNKPIELIYGKDLNRILEDPAVASHKSSVDCYLPMVMTVGCLLFFLIVLTSDLKNDSRNYADLAIRTPVPSVQKIQRKLQNSKPEPQVISDAQPEPELSSWDAQPPEGGNPSSEDIYTYTYKDKAGEFQTINTSIWLDYKIVGGRLHYYGETAEEKELAAFLNGTNGNKNN